MTQIYQGNFCEEINSAMLTYTDEGTLPFFNCLLKQITLRYHIPLLI